MFDHDLCNPTRRQFLRYAGAGLITATVARSLPAWAQTSTIDPVAQMRAAAANAKLTTLKLTDALSMISGAGGNIAVLTGPDGKVVIDSSYATAAPQLKAALAALSNVPLRLLINTHWHFDHTDGNSWMRNAGALILAHENTRARLTESHDMPDLHMHFDPSPADALPEQTFIDQFNLYFNQESLALRYYPPAHTDTDILIHFTHANVIHAGDILFNGTYPLIDYTTKGNIAGMIAAADRTLSLSDTQTKIIPGHGPLADRPTLQRYRDMLAAVRDRVARLKQSGKTLEESVAEKPTKDLDEDWGKGRITNDFFVKLVYTTL